MPALPLRTFTGREIKTALIEAIEAIPEDHEIVTVSAGENMSIKIAFVSGDDPTGMIPEHAWNGEKWEEIGYL